MGPCDTDLLRHGLQTLVPGGLGPQARGVLVPGNAPLCSPVEIFWGDEKKVAINLHFPKKCCTFAMN